MSEYIAEDAKGEEGEGEELFLLQPLIGRGRDGRNYIDGHLNIRMSINPECCSATLREEVGILEKAAGKKGKGRKTTLLDI